MFYNRLLLRWHVPVSGLLLGPHELAAEDARDGQRCGLLLLWCDLLLLGLCEQVAEEPMNANGAAFSSLGTAVSSLGSASLPLKKPAERNVTAFPPVA